MPELPEIMTLARDMQQELAGRTITDLEILQPKCLNLPEDSFVSAVQGARLLRVTSHGKWIEAELDNGWLLFNLGMGGEISRFLIDPQVETRPFRTGPTN